jgi:hypothetical protein
MSQTATMRRQNDQGEAEVMEIEIHASVDAPGFHEVSELAHHLWIERGCPIGSPEEDWFHAERELQKRE